MTLDNIIMAMVGILGAFGFAYFLLKRDEKKKELELKEKDLALREAELKRNKK